MVATLTADVAEKRPMIPGVSMDSMSKLEKKKFKFLGREGLSEYDADKVNAYKDFMAALGAHFPTFNQGDVVTGMVVQFDRAGVYLDIGGKSNAFLPNEEASLNALLTPEELFTVGDKIQVQIMSQAEDQNGQWRVSAKRIELEKAWDKLVEMRAADPIFDVEIKSINRGGALVLVKGLGLTGFLPGSQLHGGLPTQESIGKVVPVKLLDVDREANRFVVSNRKVVQESVMKNIEKGALVEGIVRTIKPFGAFVDIGISALLHISEISASHVTSIEDIIPVGTKIKAVLINHDAERQRISLSTKVLEANPGDMLIDPELVFKDAEKNAELYRQRLEEAARAREERAESVLRDLGAAGALAMEGLDADDLLLDKPNDAGEEPPAEPKTAVEQLQLLAKPTAASEESPAEPNDATPKAAGEESPAKPDDHGEQLLAKPEMSVVSN